MAIPRYMTQLTEGVGPSINGANRITKPGTVTGPMSRPSSTATTPLSSLPKQRRLAIRDRNRNIRQRIQGMDESNPNYQKLTDRLNANRAKLGKSPISNAVNSPFPTAPNANTIQPNPVGGVENNAPVANNIDEYMSIMFPDVSINNKMEGYLDSPAYDWRLEQGQKAMDRLMAARGLTNSGAEIQANQDLVSRLTADQFDRAQNLAQGEIGNEMNRGQSFQNFLTGETQRRDANAQNQFNNLYSLYSLGLGQNPFNTGANMGQYGSTFGYNYGKDIGNNIKARVPKVIPNQTVGPGSPAPFQAPFPSGPDMTQSQIADLISNSTFNNDILNSLGSLFT